LKNVKSEQIAKSKKFSNMRCSEKTQNISVLKLISIKKLYLMFLKYKQTQSACAKNESAIDYTQNSFSGNWNQILQI